jgi:hypothetical protein
VRGSTKQCSWRHCCQFWPSLSFVLDRYNKTFMLLCVWERERERYAVSWLLASSSPQFVSISQYNHDTIGLWAREMELRERERERECARARARVCVCVCVCVCVELDLEFVLLPTVSRPVRLGIGLHFGAHDQILSFFFFSLTVTLLFFLKRPLWREDGSVTYSAITEDQ